MYPGLSQLSKMEIFAVIINGFESTAIIANFSVMKVVPVKNLQNVYFKQNVYYKDLLE